MAYALRCSWTLSLNIKSTCFIFEYIQAGSIWPPLWERSPDGWAPSESAFLFPFSDQRHGPTETNGWSQDWCPRPFLHILHTRAKGKTILRKEPLVLKISSFLWTPTCVFQLNWNHFFPKETENLYLFSNTSSTSKWLPSSHLCVALCYLYSSFSSAVN